ncbi:ATP-binding cassette domain-containing protein [Gammaproteobacteria bacterium]|nr:ATP-binding cassette domain-containing protein [Gammaproteobacteria bacterium]
MTSKNMGAGILLDASNIPQHRCREQYFPQLSVCSGEVVRIIGENGSGKSTMLSALAGAMYDEKLTLSSLPSCFLSDQPLDAPGLRVVDFLSYLEILVQKKSQEVLHVAINTSSYVHELSYGQRQYLNLLTLDNNARVWLLDEPERGLDIHFQLWLKEKIWQFAAQGNAVLYASHQDVIGHSRVIDVSS